MKFVAKSYETPQAGLYSAILRDVEERTTDDGRMYYLWRFEIETRTGKTIVSKPTSTSSGPRSTARSIVEALLNRELEPGEEVELEDLLDKPCAIVVERAFRADGTEVARVSSVFPEDYIK